MKIPFSFHPGIGCFKGRKQERQGWDCKTGSGCKRRSRSHWTSGWTKEKQQAFDWRKQNISRELQQWKSKKFAGTGFIYSLKKTKKHGKLSITIFPDEICIYTLIFVKSWPRKGLCLKGGNLQRSSSYSFVQNPLQR